MVKCTCDICWWGHGCRPPPGWARASPLWPAPRWRIGAPGQCSDSRWCCWPGNPDGNNQKLLFIVKHKVPLKVKVKVGPELYTKMVFTTTTHHSPLPPSLNECLVKRVLSKSCLYHHDEPQNDPGWSRMTSGWLLKAFGQSHIVKCKM